MANIATYLRRIREAVYGREVRSSIHDAIDAINNEVTEVHTTVDEFVQSETDDALWSAILPAQGRAAGDRIRILEARLGDTKTVANPISITEVEGSFEDPVIGSPLTYYSAQDYPDWHYATFNVIPGTIYRIKTWRGPNRTMEAYMAWLDSNNLVVAADIGPNDTAEDMVHSTHYVMAPIGCTKAVVQSCYHADGIEVAWCTPVTVTDQLGSILTKVESVAADEAALGPQLGDVKASYADVTPTIVTGSFKDPIFGEELEYYSNGQYPNWRMATLSVFPNTVYRIRAHRTPNVNIAVYCAMLDSNNKVVGAAIPGSAIADNNYHYVYTTSNTSKIVVQSYYDTDGIKIEQVVFTSLQSQIDESRHVEAALIPIVSGTFGKLFFSGSSFVVDDTNHTISTNSNVYVFKNNLQLSVPSGSSCALNASSYIFLKKVDNTSATLYTCTPYEYSAVLITDELSDLIYLVGRTDSSRNFYSNIDIDHDVRIENLENHSKIFVVRDNDNVARVITQAEQYEDAIVYIEPYTHDCINEWKLFYGSDYFDNMDSGHGLDLTNGVRIIGASGSKLKCWYTGSNDYVMEWFSLFNNGNNSKGYSLENLTLDCKKIRYVVHDERGTDTTPYSVRIKHCNMSLDSSASTWQNSRACIGGGLGVHGDVVVEDCIFSTVTSADNMDSLAYHNSAADGAKSNLVIKNCYCAGDSTIQLAAYGDSLLRTNVLVSGCSVGSDMEIYDWSGYDNFDIKLIGNIVRSDPTPRELQSELDLYLEDNPRKALPAYYTDAWLENIYTRIRSMATETPNGVLFGFITDMHFPNNSGYSKYLMKKILDNTEVPFFICGGDFPGSVGTTTDLNTWAAEASEWQKYLGAENFYILRGTRDFCVKYDGESTGYTPPSGYPYNFLMRNQERFVTNLDKTNMCYTIDIPAQKVRFICLNSCYRQDATPSNPDGVLTGIGQSQAQWFVNRLLDYPDDRKIVVLSHIAADPDLSASYLGSQEVIHQIIKACNSRTTVHAVHSATNVDITADFTDCGNTVVCQISGYGHVDSSHKDGVLSVTTTSDALYSADGYNGQAGSTSEQAFDIFCLNIGQGLLRTVRVGRGNDRIWYY